MTTLTVTSKGQVTFRKEVLQHLGLRPGDKIELNLLPGGKAEVIAARSSSSFQELHGFLKGKTNGRALSIEELDEAIAEGAAEAGRRGA